MNPDSSYLLVALTSTDTLALGPAPSADALREAFAAALSVPPSRAFLFIYGDGGPVRAIEEWDGAHGWQPLTSSATYDADFVAAQLQLCVQCSRLGPWSEHQPREIIHAAGDALNATWVEGITVAAWIGRGRAALLGE